MLTKYGTDNIVVMLAIGIGLIVLSNFISLMWLKIPTIVLGLMLIIMTFVFFRDPIRTIPDEVTKDKSLVLAPADGKVMNIIEIEENDYMKTLSKRISIFLSPLDVHVNRSPITGKVEYFDFVEGKFLAAYNHESSDLNEQSKIGVNTHYGKVLFKQIVGVMARRIVSDVLVGTEIEAGDKIGMMKFGSRMDIFLPLGSEIYCKVGNRIVAGETIIAKIK